MHAMNAAKRTDLLTTYNLHSDEVRCCSVPHCEELTNGGRQVQGDIYGQTDTARSGDVVEESKCNPSCGVGVALKVLAD